MAKVIGPLMSLGARGRIAKVVNYQTWKGRQYVKQHVDGLDPRTQAQILSRDTFAVGDAIWVSALDLFKRPWDLLASGQVKSGYNSWQGQYILRNRGRSDLLNLNFSPGAKGGLRPDSVSIFSGSQDINVFLVSPTTPQGWVLDSAIAGTVRDGDPASTLFPQMTVAEDDITQEFVHLPGLTPGANYVVSGWLRWTKPDGSTAYGPALPPQLIQIAP